MDDVSSQIYKPYFGKNIKPNWIQKLNFFVDTNFIFMVMGCFRGRIQVASKYSGCIVEHYSICPPPK